MFKLSVTACSFYVKKTNSKGNSHIYDLNEEIAYKDENNKENTTDIIAIFKDFFASHTGNITDDIKQKTFSCENIEGCEGETDDFRYIYTIVHSGNYGSSADIKNINNGKIKYLKGPDEAEERPFYLFIVIPKSTGDVHKGMLLFQNVGPYGVKTITTDYIRNFLSNKYNISLIWRGISPKLFVDKIVKRTNVNKLIMIKNHKSSDDADKLQLGYGQETRVVGNLSFSENRWNKINEKIQYFIAGKYNLFEFENEQYDKLKVYVKIGNSNRTIDLHNLDNLSIIEQIPDAIADTNGHPKKDMMLEHFKNIANDYLKEMVLSVG